MGLGVARPPSAIRALVNAALDRLSPTFGGCTLRKADLDRAGRLLRALLLQGLFTIRSKQQLMQTSYNVLFRWFVGPAMDVRV